MPALVLTCASLLATVAEAQLDAGPVTGVDTPHTPVAKAPPENMFTQVAGARWTDAGPELPSDSPTPLEADLYAVAALDEERAFAAGSIAAAGEQQPVIYRFDEGDGWREDGRFPGTGYVAAVAWIDEERALAVGGDGVYPEREETDGTSICDPAEPPPVSEAGMVRAWLYEEGAGWRELRQRPDGEEGDELPDVMTALTALDFYRPDPRKPLEFGIAGGLCQLWHWVPGGFARDVERGWSEPNRLARHRVTDVTFAEPSLELEPSQRRLRAFAVTAGCCAAQSDSANSALGAPETLTYTLPTPAQGSAPEQGTWVRVAAQAMPRATTPDSHLSVTATQTGLVSFGSLTGQPTVVGPFPVTSPGGPEAENEPASQVAGRSVGISSVRLADGDGDVGGGRTRPVSTLGGVAPDIWENPMASVEVPPWGNPGNSTPPYRVNVGGRDAWDPDGIPDWSVGKLMTSGRGIAYGTDPAQLPGPDQPTDHLRIATCPGSGDGIQAIMENSVPPECRLDATLAPAAGTLEGDSAIRLEQADPALRSSRLVTMPSYGLNAIHMLDEAGKGWAVGEHGAIVKLTVDADGSAREQAEAPPRLGERKPGVLPDDSPWDSFRPPGGSEAGLVPPLAARPRVQLPEPRLTPAVGPVPTLTSRDGSRALYLRRAGQQYEPAAYLDEGTWHHCDGPAGEGWPLHPACASYAELRKAGIELRGQVLPSVVPSDDASELQVVGMTTSSETPLIRFRDGRWEREGEATLGPLAGKALNGTYFLGFTAADDGKLIGLVPPLNREFEQFRFDGRSWDACADCDPDGLLARPTAGVPGNNDGGVQLAGLTVEGERMYAYGAISLPQAWVWASERYPFILVRERGGAWRDDVPGAYMPGRGRRSLTEGSGRLPDDTGGVAALTVVRDAEGRFQGSALGSFNGGTYVQEWGTPPPYRTLRVSPGGEWQKEPLTGALDDDMASLTQSSFAGANIITTKGARPTRFLGLPNVTSGSPWGRARIYRFNDARERWEIEATGVGSLLTADHEGGFYAESGRSVYHYTDRPRKPVFEEVPRPALHPSPQVKVLAAAPDGTVWAATDSDIFYRYDRLTGWDRVRVPGWDRGRVVTAPSAVNDLAVGADGTGLAVGNGGRIARIEEDIVRLDPAAGVLCTATPEPPCGSGRHLRAVAVADDGAAVIAGDGRTLLWRPAGGELRAIAPPRGVSRSAAYTSVAIADEDTLWVVTGGRVYAGRRSGDAWSWSVENEDAEGNVLQVERLALDAEGRGFAIDGSEILERVPGREPLWQRVRNPSGERLHSVALPAGGGRGALIGGAGGLVLTWTEGGFQVARPAEAGVHSHPVTSVALAPGLRDGQVEAWASTYEAAGGSVGGLGIDALDSRTFGGAVVGSGRLLHYASDPGEPLLNPTRRATPLADAPARREGEVAFAAFGKSDCQVSGTEVCVELGGGQEYTEVVLAKVTDELVARRQRDEFDFAVWTGDSVDEASHPGHQQAESAAGKSAASSTAILTGGVGLKKLRRWGEAVPDRLADRGLPLLGTVGAQDLAAIVECTYSTVAGWPDWESCKSRKNELRQGDNFAWRRTMADRDAPWGVPGSLEEGGLRFERVRDGRLSARPPSASTSLPNLPGFAGRSASVDPGGAATHYAVDVVDAGSADSVARLVFADTSQGSLSGSDALQHPLEPEGGQAAWLEHVLCTAPARTAAGERCTRQPGQLGIVVTNTPTYSYGAGAGRDTLGDAAALEAVLMRHGADLVVSGRIGWNGRYWATAPGVHEPCLGSGYPDAPPAGGTRACGEEPPDTGAAEELAAAIQGGGAPAPSAVEQLTGKTGAVARLLPFVVASGAGGKFAGGAGAATGEARDGFWHGYSIVRLDPGGDPRGVVVEQRPVYDFIGIEAQQRTLRPGQRMTLRGFGRGPIGYHERGSYGSAQPLTRFDRIDSPAVTHRYDLLEADPDEPWLPARDGDGEYVPLDPSIATVDSQTGLIKVGKGRQGRTHALGLLSVGERAATYPLVFEPAKSFKPKPAVGATIRPPAVQPPAAQIPPPIQVLSQPPAQPPATPPPPAQLPTIGDLSLPAPPQLPGIGATPTAAPSPAPPPPSAPPPPPNSGAGLPLNLNAPISPISIVPTVIPPTPPPINPAPPGGSAARKEAKQRQAATAKSEEGGAPKAGEEGGGVDIAQSPDAPHGAAMTRRDRARPVPSMTPLAQREQPSAWARGLIYGGGLGVLAFVLAAGWVAGRPTPSRPVYAIRKSR